MSEPHTANASEENVELQNQQSYFDPNDIGTWMDVSQDTKEVIEGLRWLDDLDHLLIYSYTPPKVMRIFPVAANRHFVIKNNKGENVFVANEYTGRKVLCGNRSFSVDILNKNEKVVFSIRSPTSCGVCCGCCVPWIDMVTEDNTLLGSIEQKCSILQQKYMMRDKRGCAQLRVRGPMCPLWCFKHPELSVLNKVGPLERGLIVKVGDEKRCELEILFSKSLNTELKAVMLAMGFVFEIRNFKPSKEVEKPSYQLSRSTLRSNIYLKKQDFADE